MVLGDGRGRRRIWKLQLFSSIILILTFQKGRKCTVEDVVVDIPSTIGEEIRGDSIGFERNGHNEVFIVYIAHLLLANWFKYISNYWL